MIFSVSLLFATILFLDFPTIIYSCQWSIIYRMICRMTSWSLFLTVDNLLLQQKTMSYILVLLLILFLGWILISDFQMTCCTRSLQIFVSAVSLLICTLHDYHHISILHLSTKYQVSTDSTWSISPVPWYTDSFLCDQLSSYRDSIDSIWLDHSSLWYWRHTDVDVPTPFLLSEPIHVLVLFT